MRAAVMLPPLVRIRPDHVFVALAPGGPLSTRLLQCVAVLQGTLGLDKTVGSPLSGNYPQPRVCAGS
jgi:hypothetical protein